MLPLVITTIIGYPIAYVTAAQFFEVHPNQHYAQFHYTLKDAAFRFLRALELIDISNNLGDTKTLITHPATTTHQRLKPEERAEIGIGDGMLRLSVGLEDTADLKADLARGLAAL